MGGREFGVHLQSHLAFAHDVMNSVARLGW
jgi:hypothetical protein